MAEALSDRDRRWLGEIETIYSSSRERGEFVVLEGRNLVDACLHHDGRLRALVLVGQSHADLEEKVNGEVEITRIDQDRAKRLTGFPFHRGVLGLADRPARVPLSRLVESVRCGGVLVVCSEIGDPGNLGAIVRCAAAFGATGVVAGTGGPDIYGRKAMRGSGGAVFSLPIAESGELPDVFSAIRSVGGEIVGTAGGASSTVAVEDYIPERQRGVALVLGNEGHGLSAGVLSNCDRIVRIDISAAVESLNAACAAAVLLHAIRVKGRQGLGPYSA